MKWLLVAYVIFQSLYDHWGLDTVNSKAVYFAFQYGWVAAIAIHTLLHTFEYKKLYLIIALIMVFFSINELTWINSDTQAYAMMTSPAPRYGLTIIAGVLFFWLIISKKLQWVK